MPKKKPQRRDMTPEWTEYKTNGTEAARQKLIEEYYPLVKYVAAKIKSGLPASVEHDDLVSYGVFGLMDAIEKYDMTKGIKFETYSISRIRGAIIDELRSIDWVPRSVRSKARDIDRAQQELESNLHRAPSDQEVADHLDISIEDVRAHHSQASAAWLVALDELIVTNTSDNVSVGETLQDQRAADPVGLVTTDETRGSLAGALERLPQRETTVLGLYYAEGLTLAEIGKVLGVTESRVCQLHTAAVEALRFRLAESAAYRTDRAVSAL